MTWSFVCHLFLSWRFYSLLFGLDGLGFNEAMLWLFVVIISHLLYRTLNGNSPSRKHINTLWEISPWYSFMSSTQCLPTCLPACLPSFLPPPFLLPFLNISLSCYSLLLFCQNFEEKKTILPVIGEAVISTTYSCSLPLGVYSNLKENEMGWIRDSD